MTRKVVMIRDADGAANERGSATRLYKADELIPLDHPWQRELAEVFIKIEAAIEYREPTIEVKKTTPAAQKRPQRRASASKTHKPTPLDQLKQKKTGFVARMGKKITG